MTVKWWLQGPLDMSAEELALCSSIAELHNCLYVSEPRWSASNVRGFTNTMLWQLIDVRSCPSLPSRTRL